MIYERERARAIRAETSLVLSLWVLPALSALFDLARSVTAIRSRVRAQYRWDYSPHMVEMHLSCGHVVRRMSRWTYDAVPETVRCGECERLARTEVMQPILQSDAEGKGAARSSHAERANLLEELASLRRFAEIVCTQIDCGLVDDRKVLEAAIALDGVDIARLKRKSV